MLKKEDLRGCRAVDRAPHPDGPIKSPKRDGTPRRRPRLRNMDARRVGSNHGLVVRTRAGAVHVFERAVLAGDGLAADIVALVGVRNRSSVTHYR